MDGQAERSIVDWDENDVHNWLANLGFPQYESQIKGIISGDVLCMVDAETLKNIGIATVGQRLAILKAVYMIKLAHNVPLEADDYVPPSEAPERLGDATVEKLHATVRDQGETATILSDTGYNLGFHSTAERLRILEEENRNINITLQSFLDDYNNFRGSITRSDDNSPLRRQPSFKWAQYVKPAKSPTKADLDTPHSSPQQLEHDIAPYTRSNGQPPPPAPSTSSAPEKSRSGSSSESPNPSQSVTKPLRQESSDNLKSFKVSLDDPTWKVLPAALKKYRINNDNWENYAMFICFGSAGNRIERCLSYDEKPLLLFQKLKEGKKNPVFMLKHIKDIRSPIVVAQQKHAARKASSVMSNDGTATGPSHGKPSRPITRPPKLEVQDLSAPAPLPTGLSGLSPQPGWPELGVASPSVDPRLGEDALAPGSATTQNTLQSTNSAMTGTTVVASSNGHDGVKAPTEQLHSGREMPVASSGVSYAVAIYPYMAEQEDEFDVVVGDTFVILSRARGWWVVQRDPTGSGIVDTDIVKQGWVPAGCLLETNVPVASAIAEATAAKSSTAIVSGSPPSTPVSKTPILPLSIISTSFPGVALMDYKKKGEEELDLAKDDALRVFKRYNHWSYAVKEEGGDRGWVPSWFIGKVATSGPQQPPTPSTNAPAPVSLDDTNGQPSPMSSAFPPVQQRSTTAVI
ncbi:uncharacterized protein ARMOST_07100 [Armillaria ostoyae]|uniref:Protein kinase regulator n=1 Tax=Armillaria ostoyae TaxID=47428 RepID=A0A284R4Y0_ARMOS|nr:uncharacterized protein ARMOST_07100 [Armillaria ostoyae]